MKTFSQISRLKSRKGQALVEYALLLPILLSLLIGMIEVGQAWSTYQGITHAAREGARHSATATSTETTVTERMNETLSQASLDPQRANYILGIRDGSGTTDTVQVQYQYQFNMLGPVLRLMSSEGNNLPGSVTLNSTFIIRNE